MNELKKNTLMLVFLGVAVVAGGLAIYEQVGVRSLRAEAKQLRNEISDRKMELQKTTRELVQLRAAVEKQRKDVEQIEAEMEKKLRKKK